MCVCDILDMKETYAIKYIWDFSTGYGYTRYTQPAFVIVKYHLLLFIRQACNFFVFD